MLSSTGPAFAMTLLALVAVIAAAVLGWLVRRVGRREPASRRRVGLGASVCAVLLVAQASVVLSLAGRLGAPGAWVAGLDPPALDWSVAHREEVATGLAVVLALIGGTVAMTVLTVVTAGVLLYLGDRRRAVVVVAAAAGAGLLVRGFKELYGRHRPPPSLQVIHYHGHSLPSGHALGSTVVLGLAAAAAYPLLRSAVARAGVVLSALALALLIGVSRVYLAAHWVTDVLTGWLLGGAWLALAVTVLAVLPRLEPSAGADPRPDGPAQPTSPRTSQTSTPPRS
ncbi:MAG TPA: phosphatase PAP2 family protein [Pseudonocardia sp.]